jgi:hypothetical protein
MFKKIIFYLSLATLAFVLFPQISLAIGPYYLQLNINEKINSAGVPTFTIIDKKALYGNYDNQLLDSCSTHNPNDYDYKIGIQSSGTQYCMNYQGFTFSDNFASDGTITGGITESSDFNFSVVLPWIQASGNPVRRVEVSNAKTGTVYSTMVLPAQTHNLFSAFYNCTPEYRSGDYSDSGDTVGIGCCHGLTIVPRMDNNKKYFCVKCGDGACASSFGEDHAHCPSDCAPGTPVIIPPVNPFLLPSAFTPMQNCGSFTKTPILVMRDSNSPRLNGIAYVITPSMTLKKPASACFSLNDYAGLSPRIQLYKADNPSSILQNCNAMVLGSFKKSISPHYSDNIEDTISYPNGMYSFIPAKSVDNWTEFTITKYMLSNCGNDTAAAYTPNCDANKIASCASDGFGGFCSNCTNGKNCKNENCGTPPVIPIIPPTPTGTTIGLFDPRTNQFFLKTTNSAGTGLADIAFGFGVAGSNQKPLAGDWDGNGKATIGIFDPATNQFMLRNSNNSGVADIAFGFGAAGTGQLPITGDWDGNGTTTIGLYDPSTSIFYLRNSNSVGSADETFGFGAPNGGWLPITGDWDGDGVTTIGLYDPASSTFFLKNSNSSGFADLAVGFGAPGGGYTPLTGDWDDDGIYTIGLFLPSANLFLLRNSNSTGIADISFGFGSAGAGQKPIVGIWAVPPGQTAMASPTQNLSVGNLIRSATASLFDTTWRLLMQVVNLYKK